MHTARSPPAAPLNPPLPQGCVSCYGSRRLSCLLALLQVPCVMLMSKVKSKSLWLAGMLIAWGAVAAGMAGITGAATLYVLRVLLGIFESGALPCMW